jgi:tetratricopeptide (TPR) repeat protein
VVVPEIYYPARILINPSQEINFIKIEKTEEQQKKILALRRKLVSEPNNAAILLDLGGIFFDDIQDFDKAIEYYTKVIELDPNETLQGALSCHSLHAKRIVQAQATT